MAISPPLRVIILGATSAIAEATARLYAAEGAALALLARNEAALADIAAGLSTRGASAVVTRAMDLTDVADAKAVLSGLAEQIGGLDHVLIFHGLLGDTARAETDLEHARAILDVNFTTQAIWALAAADLLEKQRHGALVVVGSVAGDRGRASNYIYGAAKGGMAVLMQGLAHRLSRAGVRAVLIKPGFVDTPMTAAIPKNPLFAKPAQIAQIIRARAERGALTAYAPGFWALIMALVIHLPTALMHRTKL
jgi:decaprenylphospho-beta-D-erythro-pentofuranosid-2-ulose 2-reductase